MNKLMQEIAAQYHPPGLGPQRGGRLKKPSRSRSRVTGEMTPAKDPLDISEFVTASHSEAADVDERLQALRKLRSFLNAEIDKLEGRLNGALSSRY